MKQGRSVGYTGGLAPGKNPNTSGDTRNQLQEIFLPISCFLAPLLKGEGEGEGEEMSSCACCRPVNLAKTVKNNFVPSKGTRVDMGRVPYYRDGGGGRSLGFMGRGVKASLVDSSESSSDFAKRMEQAWLISQQPRPIACSTCNSNGHVECKWCGGTGFFMIGDNMLCQVHSRNSNCVICAGKGSMCCSDCKGTGFRAKWLGEPPLHK